MSLDRYSVAYQQVKDPPLYERVIRYAGYTIYHLILFTVNELNEVEY